MKHFHWRGVRQQPRIHFCRTHKTLRLQPTHRRCGEMADATDLKSVLAKNEVWVRIPSSAPLRTQFSEGDSLGVPSLAASHSRARKRMKARSICQVFVKCGRPVAQLICNSRKSLCGHFHWFALRCRRDARCQPFQIRAALRNIAPFCSQKFSDRRKDREMKRGRAWDESKRRQSGRLTASCNGRRCREIRRYVSNGANQLGASILRSVSRM
jgi:hypothetical protein